MADPRATFARTAADLVDEDPSVALVYAEISGQYFSAVERRHPDRVVNVGIREQLLVSVGAGLALSGMRPIVHTFSSFLVERAFEQIKLGFSHQDVGGVLVGAGGSFDVAAGGRTHQSPGDVALLDTLPGWTVHVPGHADEVGAALRAAVAGDGRHYVRVVGQQNSTARPARPGRFTVVRRGRGATVLAVGPTLDPVLAAVRDLDVSVLYANTVRPFDGTGLRAGLGAGGPPDGGAGGAVPGRDVGAAGRRRAAGRAAPAARPRRGQAGAEALRVAGAAHRRPRPGRGRAAPVDHRVPGGAGRCIGKAGRPRIPVSTGPSCGRVSS